ncbi:Selenoprotein S [Armadillidium nasatum]|uniref:Selenoprotein S n=1 Tax=Armadillidium nasatum TaxID=96803 RepID=A0A5N5TK15_9CRUS|nr:Selenoprotein S [Armadillidium nasatum]
MNIQKTTNMEIEMDGGFEEPDIQGVHPESLNENTPASLTSIISFASGIFSFYGWIILFISIVGWILWKSSRDKYEAWRESAEYHKNPDKFVGRENSLQAARKKMQEEYEERAREHARKLKEYLSQVIKALLIKLLTNFELRDRSLQEEEKRRANSAPKDEASNSSPNSESVQKNKPKKPIKSFRPEFNPLMSDTRSCRPSFGRRRAGGG